jgi:flagellar protein FlbD
MLKLTRLNHGTVAINPDHICWVDVSPDTTICLLGGDKIIVRESLEELISRVIDFRRSLRVGGCALDESDAPRISVLPVARGERRSSPPSMRNVDRG